jgi:hypothetical protein
MSKELAIKDQTGLAQITSNELWTIYNPRKAKRELAKVNTTALALCSTTPSLSHMRRTLGEDKVEAYIKLWLLDLNNLLDLKKPLNESQIDDVAFRIQLGYGSLNVADLNLVFARALNGDHGIMYDRVSIPTVMKWFKDYFEERCTTAASNSYDKHVQHKSAFATDKNIDRGREEHRKVMSQGMARKSIDNVKANMKSK